jgi:hypothetical protein
MTLSIHDIQHKGHNITTLYHYAECRYAECPYAECRYAEYHYAECRFAECQGVQ